MAESWNVSGRKYDDSSRVCVACRLEGSTVSAVGMCGTCRDDLCDGCFNVHCVPIPCRDHVLQRGVWASDNCIQKFNEIGRCNEHGNKTIRYYCEHHQELGCNQCLFAKHRPCGIVIAVADVASETENSPEFRQMEIDLKEIESTIKRNTRVLVDLRQTADNTREDVTRAVEENGNQLKACIDNIVEKQKGQISELAERDLKKLNQLEENVTKVETAFAPLYECVEYLKKCGKPELLFIAMKQFQKDIDAIKTKVDRTFHASELAEYQFKPEPSLLKSLQEELRRVRVTRTAMWEQVNNDKKQSKKTTTPRHELP